MIKSICLVGIGGALGSIVRFSIAHLISTSVSSSFPWSTITVNILGSLCAGILFAYIIQHPQTAPFVHLLCITGFCGGFTTFSTFTADNFNLLQSGSVGTALFYMMLSMASCLLAFWVGYALLIR